ncbi:histidine decarboxylase [Embleya sp. NPDC127516]|uniref:histidine decarboxylase n=1 Tax=Embleya sp. NPDC127516 TaxID=3363990 RepID=UPI0038297A03
MHVEPHALRLGREEPDAERDVRLLTELGRTRHDKRHRHLGYPLNQDFDYRALSELLDTPWYSIGFADEPDRLGLGADAFEREILAFFAEILKAPPGEVRGFLPTGSTEGNQWGCLLGRQALPRAPLYFSRAAHFGIRRVAELLRMEPVEVATLDDGRMDLDDLEHACSLRRGRGAVVVNTAGTTMLGAVDDIVGLRSAARPAGDVFVHTDAALSGLILPFVDEDVPFAFDAGADSVTISAHKMIGLPMPCAIALARSEHIPQGHDVEYVGISDSIVKCSRDAYTPLLLWYALRRLGTPGLTRRAHHCLGTAAYAVDRLKDGPGKAWRHPHSITVVLASIDASLAHHWHMAVENGVSHIVTAPHVTRADIDRFAESLRAETSRHTTDPAPSNPAR